jgi:hypothetical protein
MQTLFLIPTSGVIDAPIQFAKQATAVVAPHDRVVLS